MIKARIPSIQAMINRTIDELEGELSQLGRPVAVDAGVWLVSISVSDSSTQGIIYVPSASSSVRSVAH